MSARSAAIHITGKAGILFGALFLVSVLLAAIPGHHAPAAAEPQEQQSSAPAPETPGLDHDMTPGHLGALSPHMHMTEMRPENPADFARADEIVAELRSGIEKYKDYHVALNEGYKIFLPNLPQPEYHFTSYGHGLLEAFTFDPARPTSLLYRKTATGYQLVGAMYTMPKGATEDQLNERVPLSVAMWHLHTNLCMPARDQFRGADWTRFGLKGSIVTQDACDAAGGNFKPVIFGWMVHVYPYEDSLDKIFAMHHHD
jgi:hypothetical protein